MNSTPLLEDSPDNTKEKESGSQKIIWKQVCLYMVVHLAAVYALYLIGSTKAKFSTALISLAIGLVAFLGLTAGAHRLWSHRSYKARIPLRIFLMLLQSTTFQGNLLEWCLDHRVHHKHADTDADPHNAARGFFYSHFGWFVVTRHPENVTKSKLVNCSDILADPVVRFQLKYYYRLALLMFVIIPTCIPFLTVEESLWNSFFVAVVLRYCFSLNITSLVNSAAHLWGNRPYDENIAPRENLFVSFSVLGEGFHNFHHAFPWDYSTSEFGMKWNITTAFLNAMFLIGQAYDLKIASAEAVEQRKLKTGDKTDM